MLVDLSRCWRETAVIGALVSLMQGLSKTEQLLSRDHLP
jgi:hypothetical protein